MRIAVCVKATPRDATGLRLDPGSLRLDRSSASEINTNDTHAIEAALGIRDDIGAEVVVISMGPEQTRESLRPALAMGVDEAVLVTDPSLEGSDLLPTSRVLAAALERQSADLVVFGAQAHDGGGAMIWAAIAERLGVPAVTGVASFEVADGRLSGLRHTPHGAVRLEAPLPAIVSISGAINTPRYPSFRDVVAAKKKTIATLDAAALGLDASVLGESGSGTRVLAVRPATTRANTAEIIPDDGDGARRLLAILDERGLL